MKVLSPSAAQIMIDRLLPPHQVIEALLAPESEIRREVYLTISRREVFITTSVKGVSVSFSEKK